MTLSAILLLHIAVCAVLAVLAAVMGIVLGLNRYDQREESK